MFGRPARRPDRTTAENSGRRRRRACAGNTSGGELLATLAPTAGQDRAAGAAREPPRAESFRRPLRRRRAGTGRPGGGRTRSGRRGVLAGGGLFGGNVRLPRGSSSYTTSAVPPRRWAGAREALGRTAEA